MATHAAPRARLERALAEAVATFVERPATDEQLMLWAGLIERFTGHVRGVPPEHVLWAYSDRGIMAAQGVRSARGVEVRDVVPGESVVAEMLCGERIAGATDAVHGGDIAAAFDVVMGALFTAIQPAVRTSRLDIRFLAPLPPASLARIDARVTAAEGRRFTVAGELQTGGRICATAQGEFVRLRQAG